MTELEKMEADLKELQGKIKRYKEEQSPRFKMSLIDDSISENDRVCCDQMKNGIRILLVFMTTLTAKKHPYGQYISTAHTQPKIRDISKNKIDICNQFLAEIQPIVKKYSKIFIEMNSEEDRKC